MNRVERKSPSAAAGRRVTRASRGVGASCARVVRGLAFTSSSLVAVSVVVAVGTFGSAGASSASEEIVQSGSATSAAHGSAVVAAARPDPFVDPLDRPALMHRNVDGRPLMSVARAGTRLVAVGMRGLIAASDDGGKTWTQMNAPVASDLLALSFPTASQGWAVGHDGVVLHTADGGRTWVKQLDGRIAARTLMRAYELRIAAGDAALQPYLDQLALNYRAGPSLPFLSVWFRDTSHGMAVGPFGMAIATEDGGRTWLPILHRFDNPEFLHLDAIREVAGNVYIAGEKGTVFVHEPDTGKFRAVATGYAGSFFGIAGNDKVLIAYGLRGTIYRSADRGATWSAVPGPLHGTVTSATYVPQRQAFVFVTAAGEVAACDASATAFGLLKSSRPAVFTGVQAAAGDRLVLSGLDGIAPAAFE